MSTPIEMYYKKRGEILVKNLKARHFDAWYCDGAFGAAYPSPLASYRRFLLKVYQE